jgi:hypothetical protein
MPTQCSNCGSEVVDAVKTCPQCGGEVGGSLHVLRMLSCIAVGLCLVSLVGQLGKSWNSSTDSANGARSDRESGHTSAFSVTAHELATAYEEDAGAASRRFRDSRFLVTGVLTSIDNNVAEGPVVVLNGGANHATHPQATLSRSEKAKAASLVIGTSISLICTGRGDAAKAPLMKNCVIRR